VTPISAPPSVRMPVRSSSAWRPGPFSPPDARSPAVSIAAGEVEGRVLGQVRRLLASPELVVRTITAVRREDGAAQDTELEEGDVIEALARSSRCGTSSTRLSRHASSGC
jgi:hypothetical protein